MARTLTQDAMDDLEDMVDAVGIHGIMDALSTIASEKADHVRANWQDDAMAKEWDRVARYLSQQSTNRLLASPLD